MGNQNAKSKVYTQLTEAELKVLESSWRVACGGMSDKLMKDKLLDFWSTLVDPHLAHCTVSFLYTSPDARHHHRSPTITFTRYTEPYYIVERGTNDEKLQLLSSSVEMTDSNQFAIKELENYVSSVVKSYLKMHHTEQSCRAYRSWSTHGFQSAERTVLAFAKGLLRALNKEQEHYVYLEQIERWLPEHPNFLLVWREVFTYLYSKHAGKGQKISHNAPVHILPVMEGLTANVHFTPILDIPHLIFINSHLPTGLRHKWRFLFSSKIMGESFSTMLGKILNRGPTLFIVEDEDHYIFGGYAPESWALRPLFVGDETSMLFTLSPVMRCFSATGYNNHYQYLNLNQQTMPNGLGMGGQFNYWGLWIDSEYGLGQSSETCTTYRDYVQLSNRKDFRIRNLEVWGIGDEPKDDDSDEDEDGGKNKRSVLDKNLEDRVMLELSGHKMHSDGLREPDMDL